MTSHDQTGGNRLTRRHFLSLAAGIGAGAAGLLAGAACSSPTPTSPAPTKAAATGPAPTTAAAAPAPTKAAAAPAPASTTASFCLGADLVSTEPHGDSSRQSLNVLSHYMETLCRRDDNLNVIPLLATSWKQLNPTTMELKLRENVKFHNGAPLTAEDVKFSLERVVDKTLSLPTRAFMATIDHVDVVDRTTVRVVTAQPDPVLLSRLTYQGGAIVPAEAFKSQGAAQFAKKPLGTGPFKFVEWVKDDRLAMEANPDYWGGRPKIGRLIYKPITEAATRIAALRTGVVDLIANVEPQQIKEIEGDSKLKVARVRSARMVFVVMNIFRKPFDDVRVRQAMNYAVDVDAIVKDLFEGHAYRVPTIAGPAIFGYDPDQKPYPYDPAKAKALLAEAGYPNGFEVPLSTPKGRYLLDAETTQAVSGYLAKVGVKAKVEVMEWGNFSARALDLKNADNRLTMFLIGAGLPSLDLDEMFGLYLDSKRRGLCYNDPKLDAMIVKGGTEVDPEARKATYREALAYVKEQAPWIFLFNQEDVYGVNRRLLDWNPRGDEYVYLARSSVS